MTTDVFDDGSTITYDAYSNVLSVRDFNGVVTTPNRSVSDQFVSTLLGGVNAALARAFQPKPVYATPTVTPLESMFSSQLVTIALLAGAGFLVYQIAK